MKHIQANMPPSPFYRLSLQQQLEDGFFYSAYCVEHVQFYKGKEYRRLICDVSGNREQIQKLVDHLNGM